MKKGGWDCMRHYEIIMNRCLPIFIGVENMPLYTMREYPRITIKCNNLFENEPRGARPLPRYLLFISGAISFLAKECMTTNTYLPFLLRNTIC